MHKKRASNTIRSLVHPVGKWSKPQVRLGRRVACPSEKRLLHSDEFDTSKNSSTGLSTRKSGDQLARDEEMKKKRAGWVHTTRHADHASFFFHSGNPKR
jgi:ribosome assembly protein YihI (activator of Der GTPase)